jgi:putative UDP-galactose--lipooligosaccharide galactosyltransferase
MKILFLTHTLNTGGAERVGANIANGLQELGWDVIVLANKKGEITYPLNSNIKLKWFNAESGHRLLKGFRVLKQLIKILNEEKPDVIVEILHVFPHELLLARKFANWKCPIIITEHDSYERPACAPMSRYLHYKKWILDKKYDYITVLTKADKDYIGNRLKNVKVMYNPLFLEPLKKVPIKEKTILTIGRLDAWHYKGFDILISAWHDISEQFPDWNLRIIGAGSQETHQYLRDLAKGIDNISFADYTTNIIEEYKKAAIYCLSSRYEGWGLVMVEAMSQGCATIACNYKGRQAECIKDRFDGLLCEPDNITELTLRIKELILDNDLRSRIQSNALLSSKRFKYNQISKEWDTFLKSIINNWNYKR